MHLFHDSTLNTWRLITEKLPEKRFDVRKFQKGIDEYNAAIAALKQNALTVGNPEILKGIGYLELPSVNGEIFEWTGDYKTKEFIRIKDVDLPWTEVVKPKNYQPGEAWESKTVAILTLPEEKENTMENMTKEPWEFHTSQLLPCPFCGGKPGYEVFFAGYITAGNYQVKCIACTLEIRQDRVLLAG